MNRTIVSLMTSLAFLTVSATEPAKTTPSNMYNPNTDTSLATLQELNLTQEWDKVFPESDKTDHRKVTFVNRYGITLAADMYIPKGAVGPLPAIAVSGPFGAVKEQSSGLYAQKLAELGFLTIAFDPSFTGESGGRPRRVASPDINTEDFSGAVDYLSTLPEADASRIGILGICGWGGIAIQAAISDPRIKATVASTMYDMTRVSANGYFDADNSSDKRNAARAAMAAQRTADCRSGHYLRSGGVVDPLPEDAPQFVKDYHAYYKTPRGYHPRSGNSTDGWNATSALPFVNFKFFEYAGELENAVMIVHGEKAHSRYFSEDTFKLLQGDNKELLIVPGASHCDLYDNLDKIPFDRISTFFNTWLKAD
ncbi:MAG: alpha/beta hydrolase [Duncaniella sp.]|nr:alpha/beta hydrolase [Duncaniella sp.]